MPFEYPANQIKNSQEYKIPFDTRPMEGVIPAGGFMTFHGGVTILNQTNRDITVKEEFLLHKGGYHVGVAQSQTGFSLFMQVPMHSQYICVEKLDRLELHPY